MLMGSFPPSAAPRGSADGFTVPERACRPVSGGDMERHAEPRMPSERDKMLAGHLYDPLDAELMAGRERAGDVCHALNAAREGEAEARRAILRELFGRGGDTVWMQPVFCD